MLGCHGGSQASSQAAAAEASHGVVFETCNFTRRAEATGSGPEAEAEAHMFVHLVTSTIYNYL